MKEQHVSKPRLASAESLKNPRECSRPSHPFEVWLLLFAFLHLPLNSIGTRTIPFVWALHMVPQKHLDRACFGTIKWFARAHCGHEFLEKGASLVFTEVHNRRLTERDLLQRCDP